MFYTLKEFWRIYVKKQIYPSIYEKGKFVNALERIGELNGKRMERHLKQVEMFKPKS